MREHEYVLEYESMLEGESNFENKRMVDDESCKGMDI